MLTSCFIKKICFENINFNFSVLKRTYARRLLRLQENIENGHLYWIIILVVVRFRRRIIHFYTIKTNFQSSPGYSTLSVQTNEYDILISNTS